MAPADVPVPDDDEELDGFYAKSGAVWADWEQKTAVEKRQMLTCFADGAKRRRL